MIDHQVGTFNRTGKPYQGSFDVWVRNQITKLIDLTRGAFTNPNEASVVSWLNGNNYEQSRETFGILPLPRASQITLGMLQYSEEYATGEKIKHPNLAKQQQTQVAILPIHTPEERALFRLLVSMPNGPFSGESQPNWVAMASRWAEHCDGMKIFYKLPEHIKNHYKTWKEIRNEKNSIEQNRTAYDHVCKLIKPNPEAIPRIPVADRMTLEEQIKPPGQDSSCGATATTTDAPTSWEIHSLLWLQSSQRTATIFKYIDPSGMPTTKRSQNKGKKRARSPGHHDDDNQEAQSSKHRAPRTCIKCRKTDCPGRWKSEKCTMYTGQA